MKKIILSLVLAGLLATTPAYAQVNSAVGGNSFFRMLSNSLSTITASVKAGFGTTSPYAKLAITGTAGQTNPLFQVASSTETAVLTVDKDGNTTFAQNVTVLGTCTGCSGSAITSLNALTGATQTFTNDTNVTIVSGGTAHVITWAGTLSVSRGGTGQSSFGQGWLHSSGATITASTSPTVNYVTATSTTESSTFAGKVGIASSTPTTRLSVGGASGVASSSITVYEYKYGSPNMATSTTATIDASTSNIQHWGIGLSATTLTLTGFIAGQALKFIVENPNGTAGALTWVAGTGYQLVWAGGTTPTQTTTANKHDVWVFTATQASSTILILGALSANY